ncbi:hypothetical protein [Weissella paramesenteroides]|uniref:hypothetical protein n=1 Tax=Weissella paramesenteroides TaxID=1249 RepID=UPI003982A192
MRRCSYRGCRELVPYENHYCEKHQTQRENERVKRFEAYEKSQEGSLRARHKELEAQRRYTAESRDVDSAVFYASNRWRKLAKSIRVEKGYVSDVSGKILRDSDTAVDHVVKRSLLDKSEWYDRDNLWLLSRGEHRIKTNVELKAIAQGRSDELREMGRDDWKRIIEKLR